jgi:hypothetical protein
MFITFCLIFMVSVCFFVSVVFVYVLIILLRHMCLWLVFVCLSVCLSVYQGLTGLRA